MTVFFEDIWCDVASTHVHVHTCMCMQFTLTIIIHSNSRMTQVCVKFGVADHLRLHQITSSHTCTYIIHVHVCAAVNPEFHNLVIAMMSV